MKLYKESAGYVGNIYRRSKQLHDYVRAYMAERGDDYDAWWAAMKGGAPTLAVRGNPVAVDAVRDFTASVGRDPRDLALNVLDEGSAGYELVAAGRAHIYDYCSQDEKDSNYVEVDTWTHVTEADVKALWAELKAARA